MTTAVPLYAGPVNATLIPVDERMWQEATAAIARHQQTGGLMAKNNYYSPTERRVRGYVCELAFARWRGISHDPDQWQHWLRRVGDVAGCEIKFMGWREPSHMDHCEGGTLFVPPWTRAQRIVGMTLFDDTCRQHAFIDGWISLEEARGFPRGGAPRKGPNGYEPVHLIPYAALRPWESPDDRPA